MIKPDFDKIRCQLRDLIAEHGGKIEINEWNANDGETMKVTLTFKQSVLGIAKLPLNSTASSIRT